MIRRTDHLVRWAVLGAGVGVIAGLSSYALLRSLDWATDARVDHSWLLWLLPAVGLAVGLAYHHIGSTAAGGNNLLLDEIHAPQAWVPRRMAPLIFVATVAGHLVGASIGREGTALQMAGGITDFFARLGRVTGETRRLLLIAALAGGFSSVFGVPVAGCVFALEVQQVGTLRYEALIPALAAAVVGDRIVHGLGYSHELTQSLGAVSLSAGFLAKVALAGVAFGVTATAFVRLTHAIEHAAERLVGWPPLRPAMGGVAVIALTGLAGTRDYLGLSTHLTDVALAGGVGLVAGAFAWKLLFTAVSLGSGFRGGEVTPLFVIGATLGAALGSALGEPVAVFAAVGFVAVFGAAANTPLACIVMGIELFGSGAAVPMAIGCVVAYACSSHEGIYPSQLQGIPKAPRRRGRPADD